MLQLATITFPLIDPVALTIGPIVIKWYGLAYLAGLLLGWLYIRHLLSSTELWPNATPPFAPDKVDDLLLYVTGGVILGGRLGFVLFYEPSFYFANPLQIPAIWKGGMSFHGALLGCAFACWLFARRMGCNAFSVMDLGTAAVPIGLFFGRIANFINGELYGRPTTLPWGMVFPDAAYLHPDVEPTPRHPSQLYQASLEGLLLFVTLWLLSHRFGALKRPGVVTGTFLAGYGVARCIGEIFREPHEGHPLNIGPLSVGMVYSIPMIVAGLIILYRVRARTGEQART